MMRIIFTPKAIEDLEEIKSYIAKDSEENALNYVRRIFDKIDKIADNPDFGISLERKWGIPTNYRMLICESHLAFYKVEGNNVRIYRVLHSKRNCISILGI